MNNLKKLRYGIRAKIYKDSIFFPATIYLDPIYDNFIWIATAESSFLVDLSFASISFYYLELELEIKNSSDTPDEAYKKYIVLKEHNTEVPIIFNQLIQRNSTSSEQDISKFKNDRKPQIFNTFAELIQKQRKLCNYSANFSRHFKKMRLSLELVHPQSTKSFTHDQVYGAFNMVEELKIALKEELLENKQFSGSQVLEKLKFLYCQLNKTLLNSIQKLQSQQNSKLGQKQWKKKFDKLMELEDAEKKYVVVDYKINENLPLTDYFCFSSHNTYLSGNQITSDCKISRYIEDLKKGIKCVELDVHNGGEEPVITHALKGKGFCKPITFRGTIQAIDEYLEYNKDHYPIILSIQNHASRENQDLMNNIILKEFPKHILRPNNQNQFYKLSDTKGKIIIKTSCAIQSLNQFINNDQTPKIKSYNIKDFQNYFTQFHSPKSSSFLTATNNDQLNDKSEKEEKQQLMRSTGQHHDFLQKIMKYKQLKAKFNSRIDQNFYLPVDKIVQITCMFKAPNGIQTANPSGFECSSMQNTKIVKTPVEKIVSYTKKAFLRSYPEGTQIYSNNYDFLELLSRGVQIIALNTQTNDDYAIMMNAYFRAGRPRDMTNLGYIEKPEYLRNTYNGNICHYPSEKRYYEFAFYTNLKMDFKVYSPDKPNLIPEEISPGIKRITFDLRHYNQSFLVIKIADKKWVECLPLRFVNCEKQKVFNNIVARNYQFQDTGVRIICAFKCTKINQ